MHKTPALTTAQLIEARRLIVRSTRRDIGGGDAASHAAPEFSSAERRHPSAPTSDPRQARWQPTEWSETAFEPRA